MISKKEKHRNALLEKCNEFSTEATFDWLYVSIGTQRLYHYQEDSLLKAYAISTSANPPSCVENSLGTPTGLHYVARKIGADTSPGMIFKGRVATGKLFKEVSEEENRQNFVTTRILWLAGLEEGHNRGEGRDTFDRYIYIHGTNHEERIGERQSHGCVLMTNEDIVSLYNVLPENALVLIAER